MENIDKQWTNEICRQIALRENFPSSVRQKDVQKKIITRFLNFYLGGKREKGLHITDLVFATISIMPLKEDNETFIWESIHYTEDGKLFALTPEEKLMDDVAKLDSQQNKNSNKDPLLTPDKSDDKIKDDTEVQMPKEEWKQLNEEQRKEGQASRDFESDKNDSTPMKTSNNIPKEDPTPSTSHRPQPDFESHHETPSTSHRPEPDFESLRETPSTSHRPQSNFESLSEFDYTVKWFIRKRSRVVVEDVRRQYGPEEDAAFASSCNKLLAEWETSSTARTVLKYFFGIVALILMRATTKKYMHLVRTFSSERILQTFAFTRGYLQYTIPYKKCIKNSYRIFSKREGLIPVMFAKLVENSYYIDSLREAGALPLNIFKVTVLGHTADYGLGIISLVEKIEDSMGTLKPVIDATFCQDTAESWLTILKFLKKFLGDKTSRHRWARIIDGAFFQNLSCARNYELSVILGVFYEKLTESGDIWQSAWAQENEQRRKHFQKIGLDMYKKYETIEKESLKEMLKEMFKKLPSEWGHLT